jgi:hypothetical protein
MKVVLEIGTIDIRDKELARFIQSTNIDEIKSMIVDLLKKQINAQANIFIAPLPCPKCLF